ncbi:MAG: cytochrome c, class I [Halioglobus sp.]
MHLRCIFAIVAFMLSGWVYATEPVQFDYMMNCQGCHLPNGEGFPARNVPKVKDHMGKFLSVDDGREFLIRVPGSAQSDLNDERLTAVINWMLATFSANELPPNFQPYTVAEVSRLRQNPLIDVKGAREILMSRIEKTEQRKQRTGDQP